MKEALYGMGGSDSSGKARFRPETKLNGHESTERRKEHNHIDRYIAVSGKWVKVGTSKIEEKEDETWTQRERARCKIQAK